MNEFAKPNLAVSQIPSSSVADAGKALVVGQDGVPTWGSGGGGSGGGVEVVYLTLTSSNDKAYDCTIQIPMAVDPDTGATTLGAIGHREVSPGELVTFGIPKLSSGPVLVPFDALFAQDDFSSVDGDVKPTTSGGAIFDSDGIMLTSDGTVAFAGKNVIM